MLLELGLDMALCNGTSALLLINVGHSLQPDTVEVIHVAAYEGSLAKGCSAVLRSQQVSWGSAPPSLGTAELAPFIFRE